MSYIELCSFAFISSDIKCFVRLFALLFSLKVMGKAEGSGELWHGHVTALTVAPEYRRLGLAGKLMNNLEEISEK